MRINLKSDFDLLFPDQTGRKYLRLADGTVATLAVTLTSPNVHLYLEIVGKSKSCQVILRPQEHQEPRAGAYATDLDIGVGFARSSVTVTGITWTDEAVAELPPTTPLDPRSLKWGDLGQPGQILRGLIFDGEWKFPDNLVAVQLDKGCRFLDRDGKFTANDSITSISEFSEGMCAFEVNGKWHPCNRLPVTVA